MAGLVFDPSLLTVWRAIQSGDLPGGAFPVDSVFGRTGTVVAANADYYGVVASALTGATQASRYVGATASGAPASGTFAVGDFVIAQNGHILVCTTAGTPGTWTDVGASGGVTSLDTITGAITLVAGANMTITNNSPGAGQITLAATGGTTGSFGVVDYAEYTSNVSITATTEATAQNVITGNGFTADGTSQYLLEFFSPAARPDTGAAGRNLICVFFEGATVIGRASTTTPATGTDSKPFYMARRLTPSAASHTYNVAALVSAGTGLVGASTGGAGNALPGYFMVTRQA